MFAYWSFAHYLPQSYRQANFKQNLSIKDLTNCQNTNIFSYFSIVQAVFRYAAGDIPVACLNAE